MHYGSHVCETFIDMYHFSSPVSTASSSSNWHSHMSSSGMSEYDMPMHAPQTYSYTAAPYSHPAHNR